MGSLQHREKFDPFELEIIDRVYAVAWRLTEARNLYCPTANIAKEAETLRKLVFACAANGQLEFDALCDKVLARLAETESRRAA